MRFLSDAQSRQLAGTPAPHFLLRSVQRAVDLTGSVCRWLSQRRPTWVFLPRLAMSSHLSRMLAIPCTTALLLPSCQGVSGIVTARVESGSGVRTTEVRSYGLEIRNLPGYRGVTLGNRTTTYLHPLAACAVI